MMNIDSTNITIDVEEDPFKDYGPTVNDLVGYTSFDEDEVTEVRK